MKLDRAVLWATVTVMGAGLVSLVGAPRSGDENAAPAGAEQAQQAKASDSSTTGLYVGGHWGDGPYYGWCNDRYYECACYW